MNDRLTPSQVLGLEGSLEGFQAKNIMNTPDASRRPEEIGDRPMVLILPSDVKVYPSRVDLEFLRSRMADSDYILGKREHDSGRTTYKKIELEYFYGSNCRLIALSRNSFDKIDVDQADPHDVRTKTVNSFLDQIPDPTLIPPIFLDWKEDSIRLVDGNHRFTVASQREDIPYLLAYVKENDLDLLRDEGIFYKEIMPYEDYCSLPREERKKFR